jgi:hypothetical protein
MTTAHTFDLEEVMAYLDGQQADEIRAAAARAHLETCETCRELASSIKGMAAHLAEWRVDAAGECSDHLAALAQIGGRCGRSRPPDGRWRRHRAAGGAPPDGCEGVCRRKGDGGFPAATARDAGASVSVGGQTDGGTRVSCGGVRSSSSSRRAFAAARAHGGACRDAWSLDGSLR